MKKNNILFLSFFVATGLLSWQKSTSVKTSNYEKLHRNASGAPSGRTGAPGEGNCTGCHQGNVMAGSSENQFILVGSSGVVSTYIPGETYQVGLSMASNPAKKGMQVTVLNATNQFVGSFAPAAGGVNFTTGGGKTYANHTAVSATSTFPLWTWEWTAPATNVGPVKFYVATNVADNNLLNTGDVIHLSNHTFNGTVGLEENTLETVQNFNASFSAENNTMYLQFTALINGKNYLNLVDMSGKSVLNMDLGTSSIGMNKDAIRLPEYIKNGLYVVQFFVDNFPMSKTISVQR